MQAWNLLHTIAGRLSALLAENLVGVYAHGSLAFGCFTWNQSDIDFLIVTQEEPTLPQKEEIIRLLLDLDASAPKKGFEMSGLLLADCLQPVHPVPYWLHFSNAHKTRAQQNPTAYCQGMHGLDPDLAAHLTVTRAVGIPVTGLPVAEVFGPVPRRAYLDSILADVADAETDVADQPVYVLLNLCRVLAALRAELVLSKAQGGEWALAHTPSEHHAVVAQALTSYRTGGGYPSPGEAETAFVQWIFSAIFCH